VGVGRRLTQRGLGVVVRQGLVRLAGQQQTELRVELQLGAGVGGQLAGDGERPFVVGVDGHRQSEYREDRHYDGGGTQPADRQPDSPPPQVVFPLHGVPAGRQERAFGVVERLGRPVLPRGQAGTPVQQTLVSFVVFPVAGGFGEPAVKPVSFAVVGQPVMQAGPVLDEGLVRDLHTVLSERDQPSPGQRVQHQHGVRVVVVQLVPRDPAFGVLGSLATGREA